MTTRDPFRRLLSGIFENLAYHCTEWLAWRTKYNRTASYLDIKAIRGSHPAMSHCEVRSGPSGTFLSHTNPRALGWLGLEYVRDMQAQRRQIRQPWKYDEHTRPQVEFVMQFPYLRLDAVIHIEGMAEEWDQFIIAAGLSSTIKFPVTHSRAAAYSAEHITSNFDTMTWLWVCAALAADNVCLNYPTPTQCANASLLGEV